MSFERRQLLQMFSFAVGSRLIRTGNKLTEAAQDASKPASAATSANAVAAEKVTGIGGFFFRAKDPKGLGQWYLQNLGIALTPTKEDSPVWKQEAGVTIFSPFPETTKYFGSPEKMWMLNFRVKDLDKMVAQLRASGSEVKVDPETYPNGRFAHLHDPEGNPLELWEPK
jgi:glyoxylase I family protein